MALRVLKCLGSNLTSELESLLYVFLFIATGHDLPWKRQLIGTRSAFDRKHTTMVAEFEETIVQHIEDDQLRPTALALQALFFPDGKWNRDLVVTVDQFLAALPVL